MSVAAASGPAAPRPRDWRRALRRVAIALLALELLYLVGAHVFLWSSLGDRVINRRPEKLRVSWESVATPLPGLVRIRGADIRGQNRASQWHARVDRAWILVDLVQLPRRVFHTHALRAHGARFRLRPNVFEGEEAEVALEALPPIPGFELPNPTPPESLAPRKRRRRPWRLRFGGMSVRELDDLWIGRYRLRSAGALDGRLDFAIRGALETERIRLRFRDGELTDGSEVPVASGLRVDARLAVDPFDPGKTPPVDIFAGFTGSLDVRGRVTSLGFLDPFLARVPWLELDADGELEARLIVEDGAIVPGTRVRVEAEPLVATVAGNRVEGVGVMEGTLEEAPAGEDGAAQMDLQFPSFTVRTAGGRELARGDGFRILLVTDQREIRKPSNLGVTIDLPSSEIVDLGALDEFLPTPAGLALHGGSGKLRMHVELDQAARSGRGRLEASVSDALGTFLDTGFRGDLKLTADLDRIDTTARSLTVSPVVLHLEDVAVDPGDDDEWATVEGDWWGTLEVARGRFDFAEGWRARGDVALQLKDNLPVLAIFVERKAFLAWFHSLLEAQDIEGSARVDVGKRHLRFEDLAIVADRIEIAGDLALSEPKRKEGLLFARFRGLSVAVELFADGRRDWKLTQPRQWFEARRAARRAG